MTDEAKEQPRAARSTDGDTIVKASGSVNLKWPHVIAILGALGIGGTFLTHKANRADDRAGEAKDDAAEAKQIGTAGKQLAQTARTEATAGYVALKDKVEPTADVAADVASACVPRAEFEALKKQFNELPLAAARRRALPRKPAAVVPPAMKEQLPATPAAAAAAAEHP